MPVGKFTRSLAAVSAVGVLAGCTFVTPRELANRPAPPSPTTPASPHPAARVVFPSDDQVRAELGGGARWAFKSTDMKPADDSSLTCASVAGFKSGGTDYYQFTEPYPVSRNVEGYHSDATPFHDSAYVGYVSYATPESASEAFYTMKTRVDEMCGAYTQVEGTRYLIETITSISTDTRNITMNTSQGMSLKSGRYVSKSCRYVFDLIADTLREVSACTSRNPRFIEILGTLNSMVP